MASKTYEAAQLFSTVIQIMDIEHHISVLELFDTEVTLLE